jgi:hypothetical protein
VKRKIVIAIVVALVHWTQGSSQERVAPLDHNPFVGKHPPKAAFKTTALNLPFFDDFTTYDIFPDNTKWIDRTVYINNSMAVQPVTRGVATFDALNAKGGPYDSVNNNALIYADSLTSAQIDLSVHNPGDSIYLSFFFQPQGWGFSPEAQDSLMLFMKKPAGWVKVWSVEGSTLQAFKQVLVPVKDQAYFHGAFQFRFVNKASININDDIWNVDYVRLAANRNIGDTAVKDLAAVETSTSLLNDYTAMPYRQFTAAPAKEIPAGSQHSFTVRNSDNSGHIINCGYVALERLTNTPLSSSTISPNPSMPAYSETAFQFPVYTVSFTAPGLYDRVVFETKYFATNPTGSDPKSNDTIIHNQIFDNYLAYDDGTAEKSYFLNQSATLPASTAIEFHLNQPDTIRGVAIYFGRQVPLASNKFFSVSVYNDIAVNGGTDDLVYQQDLLFASYNDTVNHFWIYKFDTPVPMKAGTFFLGTIQPASSGSDSLYFGLDENRAGGNHLYVNYLNVWQPSIVGGALMIRPLLGQEVTPSAVSPLRLTEENWSLFPNPATNHIRIIAAPENKEIFYQLTDIQGRIMISGKTTQSHEVDISDLAPGIYFVRISLKGGLSMARKIIKLN